MNFLKTNYQIVFKGEINMTEKNDRGDTLTISGRSKGYSQRELLEHLPRHKNCTSHLTEQIKKIPDTILRNLGTSMAKKAIKMVREVFREVYRAKQFTRTKINNRGVLYGVVLLKHDVMDLVLTYFHERWPKCIICLFNEYTRKTGIITEQGKMREYKKPLQVVVDKVSEKRSIKPYFEDIQFSGKKIFETLYKTQNIDQRENPDYFKKMIPDKCFELPGLRNGIERRYSGKNKRLDEFF